LTGTRRLEQLLWELRDGEIAPADRAWLEAELARDPEAAAMAAEVATVHRSLEQAAPVEAPAELGERIRAGLQGARAPQGRSWPGRAERTRLLLFRPAHSNAPTWRRGWAYLAAGIVLGVGLSLIIRKGPALETGDLAAAAGSSVESEVAGEPMPLAGGRGTLAVGRRGGDLTLRLEWTAPEAAELAVSGGGGLTVRSAGPPAGATLRELGSSVWVLRLAGPGRAVLEVTPLDPAVPVEIDVRAQGSSWARRSVRLGDLP
jgi:anti-sigma factor RsiW